MLRLGIVGCGRVTTMFHLKAINEVKKIALVAVVDHDRQSMERVREACRAKKGYDTFAGLLSDPDVDAVAINTPPGLHEEMVIRALKAGKHVLCEKPLASNVEGGLRIKQAQTGTGLAVLSVHNYAFTPSLDEMCGVVNVGDIGDLSKVTVRFDSNLKGYGSKTDFRLKNEYGIVEDILPHVLSVTQGLTGTANRVEEAKGWKERFTVMDNLNLLLGTEKGALIECSLSWTKIVPSFRVEALCAKGRVETDLIRSPLSATVESNGTKKRIGRREGVGTYISILRFKHPSFRKQYEHFLSVVEGLETPKITVDDEIAMLRVMEEVVKRLSENYKT